MRFRKYLLGITVFLILGASSFLWYGHAVIFLFAKTHDMDISYKKLTNLRPNQFLFDELSVMEKKSGVGIFADNARVDFSLNGPDIRRIATDFDLKGVHFLKKASEKPRSYDTIDALVAAPFSSKWTYEGLSGKIYPEADGIRIEALKAKSDEIKMSFTGILRNNNTITSDISIYFADKLTSRIPPELTGMVLKNEEGGWKSLSVKLDGDYSKPSIQVSGKLFRLNIGVKE